MMKRERKKKRKKKKEKRERERKRNKAGYTAQDAPSTRLKITGDGPTDRRTDQRTDGHNLI